MFNLFCFVDIMQIIRLIYTYNTTVLFIAICGQKVNSGN